MPANYVLLEKITVGAAGASSVTFSGIPQTGYTDLVVKIAARSDRASQPTDWVYVSFNGSTANFSARAVGGDGTNIGNYSGFPRIFGIATASTATASTFGNNEIYVPNYTSANFKSWTSDQVTENNATTAEAQLIAGLWSDTSAITSITLTPRVGTNFTQYSTFYLYGVAKLGTTPAIVPYATGGDTIMTDGTYWYHTFLSSGTFTPQKSLSCDVLVVAGGGGGGSGKAGGGGAGGVTYQTSRSVSSAVTLTVGGGGAGGSSTQGAVGSNSIFDTTTALGGGGGGSDYTSRAGLNGGSGGGASRDGTIGTSTQGSSGGATGYGYAGGSGYNLNPYGGGGGGGAGAVGQNMPSTANASGGAGLNTWSAWLSTTGLGVSGYIAGGGGGGLFTASGTYAGGTGGAGGGGTGGNTVNGYSTVAATAGTANTGSGGGGGGNAGGSAGDSGGAGGSGLVIVRYAV